MAFKSAKQRAAYFAIKNKMKQSGVTEPLPKEKPVDVEVVKTKVDISNPLPSDLKPKDTFKRLKQNLKLFKLKKV